MNTIQKLTKFVNQRPGLEFANYGDSSAFKKEGAEIARDRADYFELLAHAAIRIADLDARLSDFLTKTSGRLSLDSNGEIAYCTGQYFPTEYRPAANRVLVDLIFASYRDEKLEAESCNNKYSNGHEIRSAIRPSVSRRIMRNYFK